MLRWVGGMVGVFVHNSYSLAVVPLKTQCSRGATLKLGTTSIPSLAPLNPPSVSLLYCSAPSVIF